MTPILVHLFKIQPLAAVSSNLVASMIMKPIGASVHLRRGTVNWSLVRWLAAGSVPFRWLRIIDHRVAPPALSHAEYEGARWYRLMQAIPLVASAALGHILFGDFRLSLTASVLLGSLPGVYAGARFSSKAPDGVIRPALVTVLLASALKLLDLSTPRLGVAMAVFVFVALPIWGIVDAVIRPGHHWQVAGLSRKRWVLLMATGIPVGIGLIAAILYFAVVRRKLNTAAVMSYVAVWGDELTV